MMIKSLLLKLANNKPFFSWLKHIFQTVRDKLYWLLPVDDKLVMFESFRSTKFADSPRAIYERMVHDEMYKDYHFIWTFEHPEQYDYLRDARTRLVKHESLGYYVAFARARYWVVNGWIPLRVQKKPQQTALQCWHGTPLKRLRYDITMDVQTEHQLNAYRENDADMLRYDYLISPSKFTSRVFASAFNLEALGKKNILIETGYPRNDVLINATKADHEHGKRKHGIPLKKKVLLYAPTWRDDQHGNEGGYEYQTPVDFDYLKKELSDEWVILFRAHNLVANSFDFSRYDGFVRDVSKADDINELYIIADALMTDYSSVFFDFANLRRPILFFMYDLDHYRNDLRGFYIDLERLPGEIFQTEERAVDILHNLPQYKKTHKQKYAEFNATYNYLDDGQATKRVLDTFISG